MGAYLQSAKRFTVQPNGGTETFILTRNTALERLTIWAVSRVAVTMSFQVKLNGNNYNAAVVVSGRPASDAVYRSGGAIAENDLIPFVPPANANDLDPLEFTVEIKNNGTAAADVTIFAAAIQHQG